MKKRYLILAGMLMASQIFSAVPSIAEEETAIVEEADELDEDVLAADDLEVIEDEELEDEELDEEFEDIEEEIRPEFDFHDYLKELGAYKGITVEVAPLEEVTEEMVMDEIDGRLYDFMEEITEGTVEEGDIANIDYVGKKDDVAFDGGTAEGYDLTIGSGQFIPGFEEGLVGVKIGDTVDLNLTFPEAYHSEDLAGQEVVFTVTVNYVQRVSEFSDEAAEKLSDGECKDMESYKALVKEELENANKEAQKQEAENALWDKIIEISVFDSLPEEAVEFDFNENRSQYEMMAMYNGVTLEDYCSWYGMTVEDFDSILRENAEMGIRFEMVEMAIVEAEGMEITEEEFNEFVAEYTENYGFESAEEFIGYAGEEQIKKAMYYERLVEMIMSENNYIEKSFEDMEEAEEETEETLEE